MSEVQCMYKTINKFHIGKNVFAGVKINKILTLKRKINICKMQKQFTYDFCLSVLEHDI